MSPKRSKQRSFGQRGYTVLRFVEDGKVKIERRVEKIIDGKVGRPKRAITVGPATRENIAKADAACVRVVQKSEQEHLFSGNPNISLGELLTIYLEDARHRVNVRTGERLSPVTIAGYEDQTSTVLQYFKGSKAARDIRKRDVREWIVDMRKRGLAERTIAGYASYLKRVYSWAVGDGDVLSANPIQGVSGISWVTNAPTYTAEEIKQMLKAVASLPARAWRIRLMIYIQIEAGPRVHQPLTLSWDDDVDMDLKRYCFRQKNRGSKRQADRWVDMSPKVHEAFLFALNRRMDGTPWVFWNHRDTTRHSTYDSINHQHHWFEELAGVPRIKGRSFHSFRRSITTYLLENASLKDVADFMNDKAEVLLRHYVRPTEEARKRANDVAAERLKDPAPSGDGRSGDHTATDNEKTKEESA